MTFFVSSSDDGEHETQLQLLPKADAPPTMNLPRRCPQGCGVAFLSTVSCAESDEAEEITQRDCALFDSNGSSREFRFLSSLENIFDEKRTFVKDIIGESIVSQNQKETN